MTSSKRKGGQILPLYKSPILIHYRCYICCVRYDFSRAQRSTDRGERDQSQSFWRVPESLQLCLPSSDRGEEDQQVQASVPSREPSRRRDPSHRRVEREVQEPGRDPSGREESLRPMSARPMTSRPVSTRPMASRPMSTRPTTARPTSSRPKQTRPKSVAGPVVPSHKVG